MTSAAPHFSGHEADLRRLTARTRRRVLSLNGGVDFASNDYLGLAGSHALAEAARNALERGVSVGSGGSRLLRGNHAEHEALEEEAAKLFGSEAALWFSTGFAANSALLATLPQQGDLIVHDELIHASVHEGLRLSRSPARSARHNEVADFAHIIRDHRERNAKGTIWIAVESLYSMDGDLAPLEDLISVADRYGAVLLVDEAHATGVFGDRGRGLAAEFADRPNLIALRTCGKALGCEGALLCGPAVVRDFLVNRGRSFIFSTAPSPLMAAVAREALRIVAAADDLRAELWALVASARDRLVPLGAQYRGSPILPIITGHEIPTLELADALRRSGLDVRPIRPPTVPVGTSRLRISITRNIREQDVYDLATLLAAAQAGPSKVIAA